MLDFARGGVATGAGGVTTPCGAGEPSAYRRRPKVPAPGAPPEHARRVGDHRDAPEDGGVQQHETETDRQPAHAERMQREMDDVDVCPGDDLLQEPFVSGQGRRGDGAGDDVHRRNAPVAYRLRIPAQPEPRTRTGEAPPDERVGGKSDEGGGCQFCRSAGLLTEKRKAKPAWYRFNAWTGGDPDTVQKAIFGPAGEELEVEEEPEVVAGAPAAASADRRR